MPDPRDPSRDQPSPEWPRIAVMGSGAVGCYFGGMLARAGARVTLIGRRPHVEAMTRDGLLLDSLQFREHVTVSASTEPDAARGAGVVLFCVKTVDTEAAARSLAPHLAAGAVVLSLQNGVDNAERIRAAAGIEVIPAVVYVAAEMTGPGWVKHTARGDLIIGASSNGHAGEEAGRRRLEDIAGVFARAGVPCGVSANIEADLWTKLVLNCASNAISALARAPFGRVASNQWTRDLMRQTVREAVAVAVAGGVRLAEEDLVEAGWRLAQGLNHAMSSTAQDLGRGRRTEIDALNGYVARRGGELGIPTPVNQTLHALVKLLEETGAGR